MVESLSMIDWSQFKHAYGTAEDIPILLTQLNPDPSAEVWEELWSRLYHQGTVYSASFAALPKLTATAASWPPSNRIMALELAGAIVSGANQTEDELYVREKYANEIANLLSLVTECLSTPGVLKDECSDFIYLLSALLAFEGVHPLDEKLEGLANGEYDVECPTCEATLFICLSKEGFFAAHEDYAVNKDAPRTALLPTGPSDLDGLFRRLYTIANDADQNFVTTQLLHFFGKAVCTECRAIFTIADQVLAI